VLHLFTERAAANRGRPCGATPNIRLIRRE